MWTVAAVQAYSPLNHVGFFSICPQWNFGLVSTDVSFDNWSTIFQHGLSLWSHKWLQMSFCVLAEDMKFHSDELNCLYYTIYAAKLDKNVRRTETPLLILHDQ